MKYIKEYLETVVKIKPLGKLTTKEDELNDLSGEMVYIDGKCSDIFISHADYANWLENKYEQKSVHKVGPKFKVGDWIVSDYNNAGYIESISETKYNLRCKDGYHEKISIEYIDRCWHLWTIKDAKPGDVLVAEGDVIAPEIPEFNSSTFIAIYKEQNGEYFNSHCYVGLDGKFYKGQNGHVNENVHPATTEQRDMLFKKMHKAGYTFDFKKKELKKNEDEPQLKEGKYYECIKSYHHLGGSEYWFDEGKGYFCEKDGYLRSNHNNLINVYDCKNWQSYFRLYTGTATWKPSDEQIDVLESLIENRSIERRHLVSLYEQLKKLKGE